MKMRNSEKKHIKKEKVRQSKGTRARKTDDRKVGKATKTPLGIEITEEFEKVLGSLDNTMHNVFITGKAGTGKSTLLKYFRNHTKKKVAVLAPTGVAALNVKGQTLRNREQDNKFF